MFWNISNIRRLGWMSLGIGAVEIIAARTLQKELGINGSTDIIQAFGVREIATGAVILAQPGLNRSLVGGLWGRLAGDALDLLALGEAARTTRRPQSLAAVSSVVAVVTAIDAMFAVKSQQELLRTARVSKAARQRVRPTNAKPAQRMSEGSTKEALIANA